MSTTTYNTDRLKQARQIIRRADPLERRIAYHESGHALVASLVDIPVLHVSIRRSRKSGTLGHCLIQDIHEVSALSAGYISERLLPFAMGGVQAERMCCRGWSANSVALGSASDIARLRDLAVRLYAFENCLRADGTDIPKVLVKTIERRGEEMARKRAAEPLKVNRDNLDLLTGTLLERQFLNGRDLEMILHNSHQVVLRSYGGASYFFKFRSSGGEVSRTSFEHYGRSEVTNHPTLREALEPFIDEEEVGVTTPTQVAFYDWYKVSQADLRQVRARLRTESR